MPPENTTHVTIDARMVNHSGIGTYIRNVVPGLIALRTDWRFSLIGRRSELASLTTSSRTEVVECEAPIYSVREQIALARAIPRTTSVLWTPHYNIPLLRGPRLVVTVHDLAHLRLAEYRSPLRRAYARALLHSVRRRASAVVFDSDFSRREFLELVGPPRSASEVVPIGLAPDWLRPAATIAAKPVAADYFLYVGNAKPHKNLAVLADAFGEVREELNAQLVIVGQTDGLRTADERTLARLRTTPGITVTGAVDAATLRAYMSHAVALVLPSTYEGFGLPPLEAMALGCPAIVSRAASLPEVCGDAALYFTPTDRRELAAAMRRVAREAALRANMVVRGYARARHFDATLTAARLADIIERAAAS